MGLHLRYTLSSEKRSFASLKHYVYVKKYNQVGLFFKKEFYQSS